MMRKSLLPFFNRVLFTAILLILNFSVLRASHALGGDLFLENVGTNQYKVTLVIYRDCNSTYSPSTQQVSYSSAACGIGPTTINLSLESTTDITPICAGGSSSCSGGGGTIGLEKTVFSNTITLAAGVCEYIFYYRSCCRVNSLTSVGGGSQYTYIETVFTNGLTTPLSLGNTTPAFDFNPITYVPVGQPISINYSCYDANGDSLVYSLVDARQNSGTTINYLAGFNGAAPFGAGTPVAIDSYNGTVSFTASLMGVYVVAVKVDEYREGVLIGNTVRDMNITVIASVSTIPQISGINGASDYDTVVCANLTLDFDVYLTGTSTSGINGEVGTSVTGLTGTETIINTDSTRYSISWTPTPADTGYNVFFIQATNPTCPIMWKAIQGYTVRVDPNPPVINPVVTATASCHNSLDGSVNHNSTGLLAGYTVEWFDGGGTLLGTADDLTNLDPGWYYVTVSNPGTGCIPNDSILLPNADATNPTISCPGDQNASFDGTCSYTLLDYTGLAVANDNCGFTTVTQSPVAGTVVTANTLVTLTATDPAGHIATCTFNVLLTDNTPPSIACPSDITVNNDAGLCTAVVTYTTPVGTDNCGGSVTTQTAGLPSGSAFPLGITTNTFVVTDIGGNSVNCSFDVTVNDSENPVAICQNINAYLDGAGNISISGADIDNGSSDNCSIASLVSSIAAFTCADVGANNVTLTATDGSGNVSTCNAVVTVSDTTSPTAVCQDITVYLDGAGSATIVAADIDGGSADNCGVATISASQTVFTCAEVGPNNITLTVTDDNGNVSTCTAVVTVSDTTGPSFLCPSDSNAFFDASCSFTIPDYLASVVVTDNCDPIPAFNQAPAAGTVVLVNTAISLTATDNVGNTTVCSFTILLTDSTAPTISCSGDQVENPDANCQFTLPDYIGLAATNDNCDPAPVVTQSPAIGTVITGTTTIVLTSTDVSGNSSTCSFNVLLTDNTPPNILCQADTNDFFDTLCLFELPDYTATATVDDNCDAFPIMTQSPGAGTVVSANTTITITATDLSGNNASCSFDLLLSDSLAPNLVCPTNQNEFFDTTCQFELPDYTGLAVVNDNCDPSPTIVQVPAAGTIISGNTTLTITTTDISGNSVSCYFDVILTDSIAPEIVCPGNQNEFSDTTCKFELPDYTGLATATDSCDASPVITQSPVPGTIISGPTTIVLTATDATGNASSCAFDVLLTDSIAPVVVCPGNQNEFFDTSCQFELPDYTGLASASDSCDASPVIVQSPAVGTMIAANTTITLTGIDATGNSSSCTFDVLLSDTIAPIVTCPGNQNEYFDTTCQFVLPDYTGLLVAVDNCDPVPVVTQSPVIGTVIAGPTTITLTATDTSGNFSNCTFDVLLTDSIPPVVTCPGNQYEYFDTACHFTLPDYTVLGVATDSCDASPVITQAPVPGTVIFSNTTVILTATDATGNSSNCSFDVLLTDSIAPVIVCPGNQNEFFDTACQFELPDYTAMAVATDSCDAFPTIVQTPAVGTVVASNTTITLTATDATGNSSSCNFDVLLTDNIAPDVICPGDQNAYADVSCSITVGDYTGLVSATDNCSSVITLTQSPLPGTAFWATTVITITGDDGNGNTSSCSFNLLFNDTISPSIVCPGDQNATYNSSCGYVLPDYTVITSGSDNCGAITLTQSPPQGTTVNASSLITMSAEDIYGNVSICSFNLVLTDVSVPVLSCPFSETIYLDENCEVQLPNYAESSSIIDNCDPDPVSVQSPPEGTMFFEEQLVNVSVVTTDSSGNVDSCQIEVFVTTNSESGCREKTKANDLVTPNGDGKNDFWIIHESSYIKGCTVIVFNRWGQKVFESVNYSNDWDCTFKGKPLPDGAYYYVIECDGQMLKRGSLTILK